MVHRATLCTLAAVALAAPCRAQVPDPLRELGISPTDIVARVGTIEISGADLVGEVNRLIPLTFFHARLPAERLGEMGHKALESLVERALVFQDARERGISATEGEIQAEFARTLEKAGPEYAALPPERKAALLERYRPQVVRRILLDKNEARFERTIPAVGEEEVRARYEQVGPGLLTPEEAHLRHILLKVPPSASNEVAAGIREKLMGIRAQLAQGTPFEELARRHSEDIYAERGGDLGFLQKGSFHFREVDEAAFALADGQTSEVISTLYGFHLVQRLETHPRRRLTLEEARPTLVAQLSAEHREAARRGWLEGLREHFGVSVLVDPGKPPAPGQEPASPGKH